MNAFSPEEAGRYLETYKAYENKPPDLIMEKMESNFLAQVEIHGVIGLIKSNARFGKLVIQIML